MSDPGRIVDPEKRLAIWTAKFEAAKQGDTAKATEMSQILGWSWEHLRKVVRHYPDFPVLKHGREGRAYRFDVVAVLYFLIDKAEAQLAEMQREAGRVAALSGVEPSPVATSVRDLKTLADTQMAVHRLKREQGLYIPAAEVRGILNEMMSTFQSETLAVMSKIDSSGRIPADIRAAVDDELRNVLVSVQRALEKWSHNAAPKGRRAA